MPTPDPLAQLLQARLAAIVESSDDAIISKSLEGVILTWNRGAARIFGWSAEEAVGQPINILIPPDRQHEEPTILARIHLGERIDHFETVRMRKDGSLIDISVTISPMRDAAGRVVAASKIARDITSQKRIERELRDAKNAAEQANHTKDRFISVLSHELRTPLTPALAEISFLETQTDVPAAIRPALAMIRRNIETEARLVDDLLDLTRIAHGQIELRREVLDVNEAVHAVAAMLKVDVAARKIDLQLRLNAPRHHCLVDPGRLQQVLLNLLSNAVKFTPSGGSIYIATANADALRIEVSDTGVGISAALLPRLFQPFEQGEEGRRRGGLGLGLSIARSLVELHGGTLTALSPGPDRGSTFVIELATAAPEPELRVPVDAPPATQPGLRVLLVEDHADTRTAMTHLLRSLGCLVHGAGTVAEALAVAEREKVDLLITDLGLPDGSGAAVMAALRGRHVRGIAISGFGLEDDLRQTREAGFETHLVKPINFRQLQELIAGFAVK